MEWISSYIFGTGEGERRPSSTPKMAGLSADDSLNRSSSEDGTDKGNVGASDDDDYFMDLDSSNEKERPTPDEKESTARQWVYTKYTPIFEYVRSDFARVGGYGAPLTVRFYPHEDKIKTQVGVYENVEPCEVRECYLHQRLAVRNLIIILDGLDDWNGYEFEAALKEALPGLFSKPDAVARCVLWTEEWSFVGQLGSVFSTYCQHLVELNIGAQRSFSIPLPHPPTPSEIEAESVFKLIEKWLPATADTLRCLRLYTCVAVTEELATLVNGCTRLSHLTLSKMDELYSSAQFDRIHSFELDKQELGYTNDDLIICKKLHYFFPAARKFSLVGCNYGQLIESVLKRLAERPNQTFEVFQPAMKLDAIAKALEVKYVVERTNPSGSSNPKSLMLWNKRFDSRVLLHRGDASYVSRLSSSSSDDSF